jgi:N6-L-threonylcarbamoyladenine synthase
VLLGGGVSANRRLREEVSRRLGDRGRLFHATPRLSLDNAAMVARAALFRFERGEVAGARATASASLPFPGLAPRAA